MRKSKSESICFVETETVCMLKLHLMEQSGKGTSLIVSRYGKEVFHFGTSFVQCILPYSQNVSPTRETLNTTREALNTTRVALNTTRETSNTTRETSDSIRESERHETEMPLSKQFEILQYLSTNPSATKQEIATHVNLSVDGVKYHIEKLKKNELLTRQGSTKKGLWVVKFNSNKRIEE